MRGSVLPAEVVGIDAARDPEDRHERAWIAPRGRRRATVISVPSMSNRTSFTRGCRALTLQRSGERAQARHDRRQRVEHRVHVGRGAPAAEREAERALRLLARAADRRAARARARRVSEAQAEPEEAAMPAQVEVEQDAVGLHPADRPGSGGAAAARAARAGEPAPGDALEQPFQQPIAQRPRVARPRCAPSTRISSAATPDADDAGQVLGARAVAALLAAAQHLRAGSARSGRTHSAPAARRAVEIVRRRDRQQIDPQSSRPSSGTRPSGADRRPRGRARPRSAPPGRSRLSGCTVPISPLAAAIETSAVSGCSARARAASGSTRPVAVHRQPCHDASARSSRGRGTG